MIIAVNFQFKQLKGRSLKRDPVEALIFFRLLPSNCLNWKFTATITLHLAFIYNRSTICISDIFYIIITTSDLSSVFTKWLNANEYFLVSLFTLMRLSSVICNRSWGRTEELGLSTSPPGRFAASHPLLRAVPSWTFRQFDKIVVASWKVKWMM